MQRVLFAQPFPDHPTKPHGALGAAEVAPVGGGQSPCAHHRVPAVAGLCLMSLCPLCSLLRKQHESEEGESHRRHKHKKNKRSKEEKEASEDGAQEGEEQDTKE